MITLELDNSYSMIKGLTTPQHKALALALSYTVGDHFSPYGPSKRTLLGKKGEFPSGLLNRVRKHLDSETLPYTIKDLRIQPKAASNPPNLDLQTPRLYKAQMDAIKSARVERRGTISMPTGSGKSKVIDMLSQMFSNKVLVIVPSLEIKKQLRETIVNKNVTIENIDSKALKSATNYDVLVIDEAHHVAAKTYQKLNKTAWKGIYYRFFLTATPFRNNNDETLLFEAIAGNVIYQLTYKQAIAEKYIVPVEGYYYQLPKVQTDAHTWSQVYSELVVNNQTRNELIAITLLRLNATQTPTLCLVKEVKHGQILSEMTGLPFVSGQDEDSRQYIQDFNSGKIKALIGTTGVISEGIDTRPCEWVIIAGLGKAKSQFMQSVGRAVRTYPNKESAKVLIFKDPSHKWTLKHFNLQKKILRDEFDVTTVRLEI